MFDISKSFSSDFDRDYFFSCYIILDGKYINGFVFQMCVHWCTVHKVLYNTKKVNYGQSQKKKTLKSQTWTYILGRREYNIF